VPSTVSVITTVVVGFILSGLAGRYVLSLGRGTRSSATLPFPIGSQSRKEQDIDCIEHNGSGKLEMVRHP
jgi:hypothetical protein